MEASMMSIGCGRTAMLQGMAIKPWAVRPMLKRTTLHYSSCSVQRRGHDSCRWRPIVEAKVDDKKKGGWMEKAKRGGVVSSVVMACVVGMISTGMAMRAGANPAGSGREPVTPQPTTGLDAKSAIAALMEVSNFLSTDQKNNLMGSRHLAALQHRMPKILAQQGPSADEVAEIKKAAMYKMILGNPQKGEALLKREYEKWKSKGGEVEYNLEMAMVEILISQGRYEDAMKYNCMKWDQNPSRPNDPRVPLYKAIIYTALMNKNDEEQVKTAKKLWNTFKKTIGAEMGRL